MIRPLTESSGHFPLRGHMTGKLERETPQGVRWNSHLVSSIVHGRFVILVSTLISVVSVIVYLNVSRPIYEVRGTIQFAGAVGTANLESGVMTADYLDRLADAVRSDAVLSDAVRRLDPSELAILGIGTDGVRSLRRILVIETDVQTDRLRIGLNSPYPHEAARIVNAVMASLASAQGTDGKTGKAALLIDPQMLANCTAASGDAARMGPSPLALALLAAVGGLVIGLGIELIRGYSGDRIRSPRQILQFTGLKTAGHLPILREGSTAGRGLATYIDPTSEWALMCRALLLNLFGVNVSRQAGTLLVTSPSDGDGCSTVAVNLATTIAMAGESVLLVDANVGAPILHKVFGDNNSAPGFYDGLDNPMSVREFVRPTHIENLHLLPCGKASSAAAAKLQSDAVSDTLKQLVGSYRYVMIDAGAALGNPGTTALAARCRATLLVLHAKRTTISSAAVCRQTLKTHGAKQMVAIVNALPNAQWHRFASKNSAVRTGNVEREKVYRDINEFGLSPT